MWKEFREFAIKGSVIDLAVGVIIGGVFGKFVSSLVEDVLMPPLGLLIGKVDFSNLFINLSGGEYASLDAAKKAGAATINYGMFLNNLIGFLITAFAIFLVVKAINRLRREGEDKAAEAPPAPPEPTGEEKILIEIRDLLKVRN